MSQESQCGGGGDNTQCTEVTGVNQDRNLTRGESGSQCGGGQYSMYRGDRGQDRNLTRGESGSQCGGGGTILNVQR